LEVESFPTGLLEEQINRYVPWRSDSKRRSCGMGLRSVSTSKLHRGMLTETGAVVPLDFGRYLIPLLGQLPAEGASVYYCQ